MAIICKGAIVVPVPGTPVQVTAPSVGAGTGGNPFLIHGILFQALPTNTGKVFVGTAGLVKATYVNVAAILPIPTVNFLPTFSTSITIAPNALTLLEFWIDADVAGEGVIVTAVRV